MSVHALEPYYYAIGHSLAPFLHRSKRHFPVSLRMFVSPTVSLSSAGCMRIQPMLSALQQSVLKKVGLSGLL